MARRAMKLDSAILVGDKDCKPFAPPGYIDGGARCLLREHIVGLFEDDMQYVSADDSKYGVGAIPYAGGRTIALNWELCFSA